MRHMYTSNPNMPKVRRDAALMVHKGYTVTQVALRYGVGTSTISKWVKKAKVIGIHPIPTESSRPHHHPSQLSEEVVWKIFQKRLLIKRCAEVVHQELLNEGVTVSLPSVKRTLDRSGLLKKRSPWKRYHAPVERPQALHPGALVQLDTIHTMLNAKKRMYTFTLIDVFSRWVYAKTYVRMNAATAVRFVEEAQRASPFHFEMLQSDHGPEFQSWFVSRIQKKHRYTRIGKPNDNAHIERFNRTIQEECLDKQERTPEAFNKALRKYVPWYNNERHHFGLKLKTPAQILREVVPRY
jgi:transposase InsO family protein